MPAATKDDAAVLEVVPCYLARNICSQLDRAAAGALELLGIFAGVSREWRDAVREAIGNEIGNLGPQKVAGSWESLRRAPWALQLRLVVRRVRLLQSWSGLQDLRPLCSLMDTAPGPEPPVPEPVPKLLAPCCCGADGADSRTRLRNSGL